MLRKVAPLLLVACLSAGCEELLDLIIRFPGPACTLEFRYGINLTLVDGEGEPITGATVTLTEGAYEEVMDELNDGSYVGAGERAGVYTMTIEADEFASQTISNIVVEEDECHVIPESLDVTLSPEP